MQNDRIQLIHIQKLCDAFVIVWTVSRRQAIGHLCRFADGFSYAYIIVMWNKNRSEIFADDVQKDLSRWSNTQAIIIIIAKTAKFLISFWLRCICVCVCVCNLCVYYSVAIVSFWMYSEYFFLDLVSVVFFFLFFHFILFYYSFAYATRIYASKVFQGRRHRSHRFEYTARVQFHQWRA